MSKGEGKEEGEGEKKIEKGNTKTKHNNRRILLELKKQSDKFITFS